MLCLLRWFFSASWFAEFWEDTLLIDTDGGRSETSEKHFRSRGVWFSLNSECVLAPVAMVNRGIGAPSMLVVKSESTRSELIGLGSNGRLDFARLLFVFSVICVYVVCLCVCGAGGVWRLRVECVLLSADLLRSFVRVVYLPAQHGGLWRCRRVPGVS